MAPLFSDDTAVLSPLSTHHHPPRGKFARNETDYYVLARLTIITNRFTFSATRLTRRLELSRAAWPRFAPFDSRSRTIRTQHSIKYDPRDYVSHVTIVMRCTTFIHLMISFYHKVWSFFFFSREILLLNEDLLFFSFVRSFN